MTPSFPIYNMTRVAADVAVKATPGVVYRIDLFGTSDAASVLLYDAASAAGTAVYGIVAPFTDNDASAAHSISMDFTSVGGIVFPNTGIYADITGTSAVAYIWWA